MVADDHLATTTTTTTTTTSNDSSSSSSSPSFSCSYHYHYWAQIIEASFRKKEARITLTLKKKTSMTWFDLVKRS